MSIPGQSLRTVSRGDLVQLKSLAYVTQCDGSSSSRSLSYSWIVYDSSFKTLTQMKSSSRDPKVFRAQPYSLLAGSTYVFRTEVHNTESGLSASADIVVYVKRGNIVARLFGGTTQSFRVIDRLTLDATGSYDEDQSLDTSSDLRFIWTCNQQKPTFRDECGVNFVNTGENGKLVVNATDYHTITESKVTVTVFGPDSRSVYASVLISTLLPSAPIVNMVSSSFKMNPTQKFQISGYVASELRGDAVWSVDSSAVDLSTLSLTPVSRHFATAAAANPVKLNLALPPGSLLSDSKFTFKLTYRVSPNVETSASVVIVTNGPPSIGIVNADPISGTMLSTLFEFSASRWQDEDLPISYEYAYEISTASPFSVMQSKSELPICYSVLPAGVGDENTDVTVRVQVFDNLNANSIGTTSVSVIAVKVTTDDLTLLVNSSFSPGEPADSDATRRAVSLVGSILNTANCSVSLDCAALYRHPCSAVDNTCGVCLSGYYGDSLYSNTRCVSKADRRHLRTLERTYCSHNGDCDGIFESCVDGICSNLPKQCPSNCSGEDRGVCIFRSTLLLPPDDVVPECFDGNIICSPECMCKPGYAGLSCSLTEEEMSSKKELREKLLRGVLSIVEGEDADQESVTSWVTSLSSMTGRTHELSDSA